jgi:chemotaxis protein methyltransferase WspC
VSYAGIAALLKEKIGLDVTSIGAASIERAVRERQLASGIQDATLYLEHLSTSDIELQELIDTIIVPETWFFRDRAAFAALARIANEQRLRTSGGMLRALSLPCSTGEEPYSIAMTLLDAGIPADRFQIDAVDISARAIAQAQLGVYGRNSFRGGELGFRDRHFERVGQLQRVSEVVRQAIRFRRGNLFEMQSTVASASYDVIFCRNLLIYFDRPEQDRAVQILTRLLAPGGVLFVGSAEAGLFLEHGFVSARVPLAFAFHKAGARPARPPGTAGRAKYKLDHTVVVPPPKPATKASLRSSSPTSPPAEPCKAAAGRWIEEAQRMADAGHVIEALQHCERHVSADVPSAQGFYLMGLLHDAGGHPQQAGECYRKALYLDPAHHEALVQLAMLLKVSGDIRGAQLLLDRAQRAPATGGR